MQPGSRVLKAVCVPLPLSFMSQALCQGGILLEILLRRSTQVETGDGPSVHLGKACGALLSRVFVVLHS